jgi:predicted dehydrogenase
MAKSASAPLRVAVIGVGGMGHYCVDAGSKEQIVAFCDIDEGYIKESLARLAKKAPDAAVPVVYNDYRKMLDEIHDQIDVVLIATPDHHHAPAAMRALKYGKHVFCQKPLAHNIAECYALAKTAKEKGVITQMGNQGHCSEHVRRACEYIWDGAVGQITETHTMLGRNFGGRGGRKPTKPVPEGVHWDEFIGPSPFRAYHDDLHPFGWRSYKQFGTGTIGDMACHNLDAIFWALKVSEAKHITVECLNTTGGSDQLFPQNNIVRYDVPARGDMVAFQAFVYDHDGLKPSIVSDAEKEYDFQFGEGTLYVGDKGMFWTGGTGSGASMLPKSKHAAYPAPEKTIPRAHGEPIEDFFHAIKHGRKACSDFADSAGPLTAFALLGHLAQFAGVGNKVEWDVERMVCTNNPAVNRHVRRRYRAGWEI